MPITPSTLSASGPAAPSGGLRGHPAREERSALV